MRVQLRVADIEAARAHPGSGPLEPRTHFSHQSHLQHQQEPRPHQHPEETLALLARNMQSKLLKKAIALAVPIPRRFGGEGVCVGGGGGQFALCA